MEDIKGTAENRRAVFPGDCPETSNEKCMIYNSIREGEGIMNYILDLLLKQIFTQPFLLLAIVVFIGYLAMKQTVGKALIGAFKASIGIIVMGYQVPAPCPRTLVIF